MIQKSPYGAFCVKLNYMEWMKQGSDILRQAIDSNSRKLTCKMNMKIFN